MSVQRRLILAVITDTNQTVVSYPSCTRCYTKLLIDPTTQRFHCLKCVINIPGQSVQWRYRLVLTIADDTAVCRVVVFGRTLDPFFGKTATDFHRSLTNLGNSGYPAEVLLADALVKTFHGKYFYFGMKLHASSNTAAEPTLSNVSEKPSLNMDSQSALNNTDMSEQSHTLVYQMIASNDGVYATVSDFIRYSIKQLRHMDLSSKPEMASCDKSKASLKCNSNQSIENSESSLNVTSSFYSKQKSVAFSFETSSEESFVFVDNKVHSNSCTNGQVEKVCKESSKSTMCSTLKSDERTRRKHHLLPGCKVASEYKLHDSFKRINRMETLPVFVNDLSVTDTSIARTLDFSNLTDDGEYDSTCQRIDKELKKRVIKQHVSLVRKRIQSRPSFKSESLKRNARISDKFMRKYISKKIQTDQEPTSVSYQEKDNTWQIDSPATSVTYSSQHAMQSNSSSTHDSNTFSENKTQDQLENDNLLKCKDDCQDSEMYCNDNDEDLEQFLKMPDSEGLQTFLGDDQQDVRDESNMKYYIETGHVNSYIIDRPCGLKLDKVIEKGFTQHADTNEVTEHITDVFEDPLNPKEETLKKDDMAKESADFNEIHMPDSEELETFLDTFNDGISLADVNDAGETNAEVTCNDSFVGNCTNMDTAKSYNKHASKTTTEVQQRKLKYTQEPQTGKKSDSNHNYAQADDKNNHGINSKELVTALIGKDADQNNPIQVLEGRHADYNIGQLPDSEELEAFLKSFSDPDSVFDGNQPVEINKDVSNDMTYESESTGIKEDSSSETLYKRDTNEINKDITNDEINQHHLFNGTSLHLNSKVIPLALNHCNERKGDYSDSGLQLSTSSIDLFASFDSTSDSPANQISNSNAIQREMNKVTNGDASDGSQMFDVGDEAFEDSWSEMQLDELRENSEILDPCTESSSAVVKKEDVVTYSRELTGQSLKGMNLEGDMSDVFNVDTDKLDDTIELTGHFQKDINLKGDIPDAFNEDTDEFSATKEATDQCRTLYESSFDSSDILFDSPEFSLPQRRVFTKPVPFQFSKNLKSDSQQSSNSHSVSSGAKSVTDEEVIFESQSSFLDSQKSLFESSPDQQSRIGDMKPVKKVLFSKKLRRVSSCRLMDIRMKENRSPMIDVMTKPKPCIKAVNNYADILYDGKPGELRCQPAESDKETSDDDSFFVESSQVLAKSDASTRIKGLGKTCAITKPTNERTRDVVIPSTPDFWNSSFDGSIIDTSLDVSSDFNKALAFDTPARCDNSVLNETDNQQSAEICDSKDRSLYHQRKPLKKLTTTSNMTCTDSPDIFSQIVISKTTTGNIYRKTGTVNRGKTASNWHEDNKASVDDGKKNLKCLVSTTPNCDNCAMSKCVKYDDSENDFSPDSFFESKCENEYSQKHINDLLKCRNEQSQNQVAISKCENKSPEDNNGMSHCGNNFSPDLFGDDESFKDCDIETNVWNVPSVLCKQLFF